MDLEMAYKFWLEPLSLDAGEMAMTAVANEMAANEYFLRQATPVTINDPNSPFAAYVFMVFEKMNTLTVEPLYYDPQAPEEVPEIVSEETVEDPAPKKPGRKPRKTTESAENDGK